VDTTGAGDAFGGAFLHGLCAGMDAFAAGRLGVVVAGLKCRGRGAIHSLPRRDEVIRHVQAVRGEWGRDSSPCGSE